MSKKIENLHHCPQLDTLNLSHNYIKCIGNCDSLVLPQLNTLNLSHNALTSMSDLEQLVNCKTLSVLDLSYNRIDDVLIVKILSQMPELRVLTLTGNPVINDIPSYRKTLINECVRSHSIFNRLFVFSFCPYNFLLPCSNTSFHHSKHYKLILFAETINLFRQSTCF